MANLLDEAIADAKALRSLAIETAKDTLLETFRSDIESLVQTKLNLNESEEEDDKAKKDSEDDAKKVDEVIDETLTESDEEEKEEPKKAEDEEEITEMSDDELSEIIAELERELSEASEEDEEEAVSSDTEDQEDELEETKAEDAEEETKSDDEEEKVEETKSEEEEDEKSLDELIEDFLKEEGDEEELEETKSEGEEEELKESGVGDVLQTLLGVGAITATAGVIDTVMKKLETMAEKDPNSKAAKAFDILTAIGKGSADAVRNEVEEKYENTIKEVKSAMNEVNLMNSKLLYANRLFREFELTESQKKKVLESFDRTETIRESKIVYATLIESYKTTVKRAKNFGSAVTESTKPKTEKAKELLGESSAFAARFRKLANIKEQTEEK